MFSLSPLPPAQKLSLKPPPQATRHPPLPLRSEPGPSSLQGPGPLSLLFPPQASASATPLPQAASQAPTGLVLQSFRGRLKPDLLRGLGQCLRWTPHPPPVVTCLQLFALSGINDFEVCPSLSSNPQHGPCPVPRREIEHPECRDSLAFALHCSWTGHGAGHAVGAQQLARPKKNQPTAGLRMGA